MRPLTHTNYSIATIAHSAGSNNKQLAQRCAPSHMPIEASQKYLALYQQALESMMCLLVHADCSVAIIPRPCW